MFVSIGETASNKGSGNRDRGTRKGTKVARQERPNIKYNERQKSF